MTPSQITSTPGPEEGVQRAAAPREDAAGLNPWGRGGGHLGGGLRETALVGLEGTCLPWTREQS